MLRHVVPPESRRLLDLGYRRHLAPGISGEDKRQGDGMVEDFQRFDDGCLILLVSFELPFLSLWVDVAKG